MAGNTDIRLTFQETDEADKPTATYVFSDQDARSKAPPVRVDVMQNEPTTMLSTKPLLSTLSDIFLPSGYPQSVSDDYLPYQIFDSLQAFCSSIAGLLSSRAVLQGVGVGDADASPTSALLLHILQDTSGRIATILFAHRVGTALEPECKTYRLAADVFNDIAMILDCLSPMVPAGVMRVSVLSTAGILRALCGVAGGSSKASLSAHFARWGNLAELNAKDSSQETIISLLGMLVGSVVVSHITGFKTTWALLLTLLAAHLALNYTAVRAVQMTSINRQRANIIFSTMLNSSEKDCKIPAPAEVAYQERIFHRDGALEWTSKSRRKKIGTAEIGVSVSRFLKNASRTTSGSYQTSIPMKDLHAIFKNEEYILFLFPRGNGSYTSSKCQWHASIILKKGCPVQSQLKAWTHALLAVRVLTGSYKHPEFKDLPRDDAGEAYDSVSGVVQQTLEFMNHGNRMQGYLERLAASGWEVDIAALETGGRRRITSPI
ncbi:uncharacterized protein N7483_001880 [Penicillium malachiteum]|uniref:uncharacterized protein n=1 Tax=Penicillium malachiteum TaxID=1324776 RepID=UPI0025471034|nr:uncharacterized protein N7483_001880 [Penicillium malachiteum]KAJ5736755.1 hypothetical protein N7483_001880 [Penicillium malachiteum]